MKQITLKIQAGQTEEIGVVGDYVRIKTASVQVRIQVESGDVDATIEQGDALNLKPFTRLVISHADAAEQTITLLIGDGTSADSAKVGGSVSVSNFPAVAVQSMSVGLRTVVGVGATNTAVLAAQARKYCLVQNIGAGKIWFRFGGSAAVDDGVLLLPGAAMVFDVVVPNDAINAISDVAGTKIFVMQGL